MLHSPKAWPTTPSLLASVSQTELQGWGSLATTEWIFEPWRTFLQRQRLFLTSVSPWEVEIAMCMWRISPWELRWSYVRISLKWWSFWQKDGGWLHSKAAEFAWILPSQQNLQIVDTWTDFLMFEWRPFQHWTVLCAHIDTYIRQTRIPRHPGVQKTRTATQIVSKWSSLVAGGRRVAWMTAGDHAPSLRKRHETLRLR